MQGQNRLKFTRFHPDQIACLTRQYPINSDQVLPSLILFLCFLNWLNVIYYNSIPIYYLSKLTDGLLIQIVLATQSMTEL